jgi:hypothetical protein
MRTLSKIRQYDLAVHSQKQRPSVAWKAERTENRACGGANLGCQPRANCELE